MKKMMDSTTVIITTTDNRVLLQKRDENPDIEYSGYYSLVSGYLEEEETPLDEHCCLVFICIMMITRKRFKWQAT